MTSTMTSTPPAHQSRRRFIQLLGGGAVLAAAPALTGCAGMPDEAISAWKPADASGDVRRFMLAHALLAPNPHNRQPWLADLRKPGEITLICDAGRLLPHTDPFGRQIVVGCGAFVELAVIAAAERGYRVEVEAFPKGEPGPTELPGGRVIARLALTADAAQPRDPLFAQIPRRHTHKGEYLSDRTLPAGVWAALRGAPESFGLRTGQVTDAEGMQGIRSLTRTAFELECLTPRTWLESAHLMRIGPSAIAQHRDGISITGVMPRLMHSLGVFDPLEVPRQGSSGLAQAMDHWAPMETGSGYFWIASEGNTRASQLQAGRAYVRAHLAATAAGVDMHPLSQALQEFEEMRPHYRAVHRLLGFEPQRHTVQMLARVGYGSAVSRPSPRRELAGLLLGSGAG